MVNITSLLQRKLALFTLQTLEVYIYRYSLKNHVDTRMIYAHMIWLNDYSTLSPPRGSTICLAGCGIWLIFVAIFGMGAENGSEKREF